MNSRSIIIHRYFNISLFNICEINARALGSFFFTVQKTGPDQPLR